MIFKLRRKEIPYFQKYIVNNYDSFDGVVFDGYHLHFYVQNFSAHEFPHFPLVVCPLQI